MGKYMGSLQTRGRTTLWFPSMIPSTGRPRFAAAASPDLSHRHCQSKFVYFAKTSEPHFVAIYFPAFFRVDLSGSMAAPSIWNFALTMPLRALLFQRRFRPKARRLFRPAGLRNHVTRSTTYVQTHWRRPGDHLLLRSLWERLAKAPYHHRP